MSEFLDEVRSVFSYLNDDYDIKIVSWHLDSIYIRIDHNFHICNSANYNIQDINELLDRSQRITALFESIMDCLLRLSITGDLYHNTSLIEFDSPSVNLSLSRNYFSGSKIIQKKVQ